MKKVMGSMLVLALLIAVVPANATRVSQVFRCEQDDDATEKQINALAKEWVQAARTMKGGENIEAWVYYPVAVNDMGESDLLFIVVAPSFEEWGVFWDNYEGSAAAKVDGKSQDLFICPDSALWESVPAQ